MTVVAIVRVHDRHRLCAGRRHRGADGRVRMHRAGAGALGQRLDTVRAGWSACEPVALRRCRPGLRRVSRASTRQPCRDDPITVLPTLTAETCLRRRKWPPTRHYLQTTLDNRRSAWLAVADRIPNGRARVG